jgi:large subunit ribosomal protein L24
MKLKKGDTVKISIGKDAGKTASIEKIIPKKNMVLLGGVNQFKRHIKAKMPGQKSEIVTITKPLHTANVQFMCPKCKKPSRIGYKILKDDKTRICRSCKAELT